MKSLNIYKTLNWLNELPAGQADELFYQCSGSMLWAGRMTKARPFNMLESLYDAAERNWFSLPSAERITAFSNLTTPRQSIFSFAARPQPASGTDEVVTFKPGSELAEALRLYHEKFGFIFVLCASGKSSEEQLAICKARFGNSTETELQIAAEEHRKIIEIRLNKLLEQ